jgi:ParB family transcriptional regulator, chromosome partitioning protein
MKLDFIDLGKLCVSKSNMRYARRAPDVSDLLPTVRRRGVIVPILVRSDPVPAADGGTAFEIVAGARRFHAANIVAAERHAAGEDVDPMPCAILDASDDADAVEASLIENMARLDPDEVTQWETFSRLVREGRSPADLSATFGLPDLTLRRILALGNLLPRIRDLYRREKIDRTTVRHLTMASKSMQRAWLALLDAPDAYVPTGNQLKAWLFGGQSIAVKHALFDCEGMSGIVADLFGEDRYFSDADAFWSAQNAAIDARRDAYIEAGWRDVVIVRHPSRFDSWQHARAPKRKGGRVYIEVRAHGEVTFHEGYVTSNEARRIERGEAVDGGSKPPRGEVTGPMGGYIDLHRHAAVRAELADHPSVALRLMIAHAITRSALWNVRIEPQTARSDEVRDSVETCCGETCFDGSRRRALALLGFSGEEAQVTGGEGALGLAGVFLRLQALDDACVMAILAVVMGETLAVGSIAVEAAGVALGTDMARWWQADDAFFDLLRDRQVLGAIVAEVAGDAVASANATEKSKTLKAIVRNHLDGAEGRDKRVGWVPRWMTFAPSGYTDRGGIGTVERAAELAAAQAITEGWPEPEDEIKPVALAA